VLLVGAALCDLIGTALRPYFGCVLSAAFSWFPFPPFQSDPLSDRTRRQCKLAVMAVLVGRRSHGCKRMSHPLRHARRLVRVQTRIRFKISTASWCVTREAQFGPTSGFLKFESQQSYNDGTAPSSTPISQKPLPAPLPRHRTAGVQFSG
jgi:hypothetical protein